MFPWYFSFKRWKPFDLVVGANNWKDKQNSIREVLLVFFTPLSLDGQNKYNTGQNAVRWQDQNNYSDTTCISWEIGSYNTQQSRRNEHMHFCRNFVAKYAIWFSENEGGIKGRLEVFPKFIRFSNLPRPLEYSWCLEIQLLDKRNLDEENGK